MAKWVLEPAIDEDEDVVNNPPQYNSGGIECIDAMKAIIRRTTPCLLLAECLQVYLALALQEWCRGFKESSVVYRAINCRARA